MNQTWLPHMLNAFRDHCHAKSLSFETGPNASTSYKEEQHMAFRTEADTMAQLWMSVLSKYEFRSRKLFKGQTTMELTAKNLWARKTWKVILSCVFHNKTPSVTYPANRSEFSAENADGTSCHGTAALSPACNGCYRWCWWMAHSYKRPDNPQWQTLPRKYSDSFEKDTHSSLSSFVTIHLPWGNKMSRK